MTSQENGRGTVRGAMKIEHRRLDRLSPYQFVFARRSVGRATLWGALRLSAPHSSEFGPTEG